MGNMFSVFGLFALILFGLYWCYEVVGRWREDLNEFRAARELGRKAGILIVWTMTVLIGAAVAGMAFILAVLTIRELRAWLGVG